jgi:hypothetical protein
VSFLSFLPAILGAVGSIFGGKGKKTEYTTQGDPQQKAAYSALLKMLMQKMGQPGAGYGATSTAMNNLGNMFYGGNVVNPQQQQQTSSGGLPAILQQLMQGSGRTPGSPLA